MNAPDIVKEWRKVVNDYVQMGRDSHLVKNALEIYTPCQILLGVYSYSGNKGITIPIFIRHPENWLEEDEIIAEIELARLVTKATPPCYYAYMDLRNEESAQLRSVALSSLKELIDWAESIVA